MQSLEDRGFQLLASCTRDGSGAEVASDVARLAVLGSLTAAAVGGAVFLAWDKRRRPAARVKARTPFEPAMIRGSNAEREKEERARRVLGLGDNEALERELERIRDEDARELEEELAREREESAREEADRAWMMETLSPQFPGVSAGGRGAGNVLIPFNGHPKVSLRAYGTGGYNAAFSPTDKPMAFGDERILYRDYDSLEDATEELELYRREGYSAVADRARAARFAADRAHELGELENDKELLEPVSDRQPNLFGAATDDQKASFALADAQRRLGENARLSSKVYPGGYVKVQARTFDFDYGDDRESEMLYEFDARGNIARRTGL